MKIVPENTAITTGIARSAQEMVSCLPKGIPLLDYGAGKLRNAYFLLKEGYQVSILETPLQLQRLQHYSYDLSSFRSVYSTNDEIKETYPAVLCSFVLNVIPHPEIRSDILFHIHSLLYPQGLLFVEVRKIKGIYSTKYRIPYRDGFAIGKGEVKTFQKPFEKEEFRQFLQKHGFVVREIYSTSDSWYAIAQKPFL